MKEFFPRELWSTIDPDHKEDENQDGVGKSNTKGKSLQIPGYKKAEGLGILENEIEDDRGEDKDAEDEDVADEEVDEEFDEEEEGGDYNAEQYFDDGGDDGGDDYDAG